MNDIHDMTAELENTVAELNELGMNAVAVLADVSDPSQNKEMFEIAVKALGRLDVVVANAGILFTHSMLEATADDWDKIFSVNSRGVFLTYQNGAKQMIAEGHGGKIIGIASIAAYRGAINLGPYSASKFAVRGLTQVCAMEWAQYGINCNAVCPGITLRAGIRANLQGIVDTKMRSQVDSYMNEKAGGNEAPGTFIKQAASRAALNRVETPDDVAKCVSFLASPDSDFMTG